MAPAREPSFFSTRQTTRRHPTTGIMIHPAGFSGYAADCTSSEMSTLERQCNSCLWIVNSPVARKLYSIPAARRAHGYPGTGQRGRVCILDVDDFRGYQVCSAMHGAIRNSIFRLTFSPTASKAAIQRPEIQTMAGTTAEAKARRETLAVAIPTCEKVI